MISPRTVQDQKQQQNNMDFYTNILKLQGYHVIGKTTAPTVNDDRKNGYYRGTWWADTTNYNIYFLYDDTIGSAVWKQIVETDGATMTGDLNFEDGAYLVFDKASGNGIKIDADSPDYAWMDLLGEITIRSVAATDPSFVVYKGGIYQYRFAAGKKVFNAYHIPHDYVPGTDIYIHVHWSHNSAIVTGGSVTWGFEVSYAKGHNQEAFGTNITPSVVGNASTTQYRHIITELQLSASSPTAAQLDSDDMEVDGLILVATNLSANNITSSGAVPDPFVHYVDIHYQSTGIGTKQKAPDFYGDLV